MGSILFDGLVVIWFLLSTSLSVNFLYNLILDSPEIILRFEESDLSSCVTWVNVLHFKVFINLRFLLVVSLLFKSLSVRKLLLINTSYWSYGLTPLMVCFLLVFLFDPFWMRSVTLFWFFSSKLTISVSSRWFVLPI